MSDLPDSPKQKHDAIFGLPQPEQIDVSRFTSYGELVQHQFQEIMSIGGMWEPYIEALRAKFTDYDESIAQGFDADMNDPDDALYRSLTREEVEQLLRGDGIFIVGVTTSIFTGHKFYDLSQADQHGNYRPLTKVDVCWRTESGEHAIKGSFTYEQATLVARLGEEMDAFLRTR